MFLFVVFAWKEQLFPKNGRRLWFVKVLEYTARFVSTMLDLNTKLSKCRFGTIASLVVHDWYVLSNAFRKEIIRLVFSWKSFPKNRKVAT